MISSYHAQTIKVIETMAIHDHQISAKTLMERAAKAALDVLMAYWPLQKNLVIFCGKGNNGGDGYVLAQLASTQGYSVKIRHLAEIDQLPYPAKEAAQKCIDQGLDLSPFDQKEQFLKSIFVDAILGIGLQNEVKSQTAALIKYINEASQHVLSLDIPSGLSADTGAVCGSAVKAEVTVTFIGYKRGLFTGSGPELTGKLYLDNLSLPEAIFDTVRPDAWVLDTRDLRHLVPSRTKIAHKGLLGHVLVIGGNYGMTGAVLMAAEAAARTGSGLVTVATRPEHLGIIISARPELMCWGIQKAKQIDHLLERATVVVIGPGLGQDHWAKTLLKRCLQAKLPMIMDADALNLLAKNPIQNKNWILTPHPGEAARLLKCSVADIQQNRFEAAQQLQKQYQSVIVLKGAGTIIQAEQNIPVINQLGNPGMASGGMGDLLSGTIAGLLAQGLSLAEAAMKGVLIHSRAADLAAFQGGERGLLATDLLPFIRRIVND